MSTDWRDVPMPARLAERPRDTRGFPITFVTQVGSDGRPDFTVLNPDGLLEVCQRGLCGLCGHELEVPFAFIGGPISCTSGHFVDPPMHVDCAEYALAVCPHLATPTARYSKPSPDAQVIPGASDERPEVFGLYITNTAGVEVYDQMVVFFADKPEEVRWHGERPEQAEADQS